MTSVDAGTGGWIWQIGEDELQSATASHRRGSAPEWPDDGNAPAGSWTDDLNQGWHYGASLTTRGNEPVSDEMLWADFARRARERWVKENPY